MIGYVTIVAVVIYIIGFATSITTSTTSYHCRDDFSSVDTRYRDAEPKDAWLAIIWPIRIIISTFFIIIALCNHIISYPLLLTGFKYQDTNLYKKIDKICENGT